MRDESYLYLWIQDPFGKRLHWFKKMTVLAGSPLGFMASPGSWLVVPGMNFFPLSGLKSNQEAVGSPRAISAALAPFRISCHVAFQCCSSKTIAMDRATDGLLPWAACMALSDTMRSRHQRSGFEVGSRLSLSNPVFEVHCVFSNRALSCFSGSHQGKGLYCFMALLDCTDQQL